jgi:hypothetical protein
VWNSWIVIQLFRLYLKNIIYLNVIILNYEKVKKIIISSNFFKILLIYYADLFFLKSNIILFFPWYGRLAGNYRQVIGLSVVLLSEVDKNLV